MAVKDTKEAALGPVLDIFFRWWLHDVEDNGYSILIIVPYDALVGVRCVTHDYSIFSNTAFCGLPTWEIKSHGVGWRAVAK